MVLLLCDGEFVLHAVLLNHRLELARCLDLGDEGIEVSGRRSIVICSPLSPRDADGLEEVGLEEVGLEEGGMEEGGYGRDRDGLLDGSEAIVENSRAREEIHHIAQPRAQSRERLICTHKMNMASKNCTVGRKA